MTVKNLKNQLEGFKGVATKDLNLDMQKDGADMNNRSLERTKEGDVTPKKQKNVSKTKQKK